MAIEIASLRSEWCQKFEAMLRANNARFDASDARHERSGAELYGRGSKGPPTGPVKRPSKRPSARHRAPCLALRLAPHQATISSSTPGTRSLIWPHMHVAGRACARWSRSSLACSRRRSASASRPARRLALSWLAWRRCPRSRAARTAARAPAWLLDAADRVGLPISMAPHAVEARSPLCSPLQVRPACASARI